MVSHVKAAVVGAGSFIFGPSLLKSAIAEHRLDGLELALIDPNGLLLELIAGVGRRMAADLGVKVRITTHARQDSTLDGADFVICSAAHELHRRFEMDCQIIDRLSPGHLVSEFGGVAGISYSLRQITLIQEICANMRRLCPKAWLLNLANPLPRVSQAAHEEGVRTVGFCSISLAGYDRIWRILHGQSLSYPFEPARHQLDVTMGGLNHFSWVLGVRDPQTGRDIYPNLREKAIRNYPLGEPLTQRMLAETGYLLAPGDEHIKDFLTPQEATLSRSQPSHGTSTERQQRIELMRKVAEGLTPWQQLMTHESWEKPIDLIVAMVRGRGRRFHAMNLINRGQISALPASVFVETPAVGTSGGPLPEKVELPAAVLPVCQRTAQVTDTLVRAARERSRRLLHEAINLDPTILDKNAARVAVDACLEMHRDIIPTYS